jgi:hypothetical protein
MIARHTRAIIAIVLLGLAAYAPVLSTGFLYDDHLLIESNEALRDWSTVSRDFTQSIFGPNSPSGLYRPLQSVMNRVEYSLWRLQSASLII